MDTQTSDSKKIFFSVLITIIAVLLSLIIAEVALRIKNSDGKNYHIEMWKYSRDLKHKSDDPVLGHEHTPGKSAKLQNVEIRINKNGMRGAEIPLPIEGQRRIMFLGSSATLGWGVAENETVTSIIQKKFEEDGQKNVVVMNAGIGNYNAKRYVELFMAKNTGLKPTDIVVNYYVNDAEILEAGGGNIFLKNSEIAITLWILANRFLSQNADTNLLSHYAETYQPDYPGYKDMKASLQKLADYAKANRIRLYFVMMPEVHDLENYQYGFVHEKMRDLVLPMGYVYIDPLKDLQNEETNSLWAMPGDPHPNAKAHSIFAGTTYPVIKSKGM